MKGIKGTKGKKEEEEEDGVVQYNTPGLKSKFR